MLVKQKTTITIPILPPFAATMIAAVKPVAIPERMIFINCLFSLFSVVVDRCALVDDGVFTEFLDFADLVFVVLLTARDLVVFVLALFVEGSGLGSGFSTTASTLSSGSITPYSEQSISNVYKLVQHILILSAMASTNPLTSLSPILRSTSTEDVSG